jgi:hypothetical protein
MKPRDGPAADDGETTMATKSQSPAPQPSAPAEPPRQPTHRLYRVNGDGKAAIWTPIGAAWPNKDGKGFNLNCDAVPLTGRIVLRLIEPRPEAAA